jgi:TonB family protein
VTKNFLLSLALHVSLGVLLWGVSFLPSDLPTDLDNQRSNQTEVILFEWSETGRIHEGLKEGKLSRKKDLGEKSQIENALKSSLVSTPGGAGIEPASPLAPIKPKYPRSSRRRGEEGVVSLTLMVLSNGTPSDVKIVKSSGFSALDNAALMASRSARFKPARKNGMSVDSERSFRIRFELK